MSEPKYRLMVMGGYHGKSRVAEERRQAAGVLRLLRRVWRRRSPLQELVDASLTRPERSGIAITEEIYSRLPKRLRP